MNKQSTRALLVSLIMIFSSLAGCLGDATDDENGNGTLGTVIVSTYHIEQLVSAVAGDVLDVEIISPSNVPVHDYEPSAADLITLQSGDMFMYHGLNLEPWVESTIASLGNDAPLVVMTHAMPGNEASLDYESMLIADLCEHLTDGPFEDITLAEDSHDVEEEDELHAEHVAYNMTMPVHEEDHEEDDHDEDHHDEDAHDEDEHEGHGHGAPEETITNPEGCPTDSVVYIFHFEEGEHTLEFETEDMPNFAMTVLPMGGGHAHHDHAGHGDEDGHDEHEEGVCHDMSDHTNNDIDNEVDCEAAGYMWMEDDGHDDDEGDSCHDTTTHQTTNHTTEEDCEAAGHMWMEEDGHGSDHGNHEEHHTPEEVMSEADENNDSHLSWEEFWHFATEDHDDHDEDGNETEGHDDHDEDGNETEGHDEHDEHDEHEFQEMFNASDVDGDQMVNLTELHELMEMVEEHEEGHDEHEAGIAVLHIEEEGDYGIALPASVEFNVIMAEGGHDDHDDHDDHADEDGHDEEEEGHDEDEEGHDEDEEGHDDHDEEALAYDPHSWLDPLAFKAQINVVLENLSATFPSQADTFEANAEAYIASLDALHADYDAAFSTNGSCSESTVIANHAAYAYLGERYGLEFVTVHGIDPEGEPSAEDIAEVVERISEDGITVFFIEEYTSESAVSSIVDQTKSDTMPNGVSIKYLYTMELPPSNVDDDYLSMMQKNLDNLKSGLGC